MNIKQLFTSFVILVCLSVSACAPQSASNVTDTDCVASRIVRCTSPTVQANPADRFAGTWTGTMSFDIDPNRKEDVIVTIPSGCTAGSVCGSSNNTTVSCHWQITLAAINGNVFEYTFSNTLSGECPALGGGTLILQSDGTLMREHKAPSFTASGVLTRK